MKPLGFMSGSTGSSSGLKRLKMQGHGLMPHTKDWEIRGSNLGVLCLSLFCYALLCFHSSFAIIMKRKRNLIALLLLSFRCIITINVVWLFLIVPWVGLQCVVVVFPDHTHLLFGTLDTMHVVYPLHHSGSETVP